MARILFITQTLGKGGTEKQLSLVADRCREFGHESIVFALCAGGWWEDYLLSRNVAVKRPGVCFSPKVFSADAFMQMRRLVSHIRQNRPDVVVSFLYLPSVMASLAARLAGVPVTIACRRDNGFQRKKFPLPRIVEKLSYFGTTRFVANSLAVRESLMKDEGISSEEIDVIYNGVELPAADPQKYQAARRELGIGDDRMVVGMVANFWPHKNQLMLVRAAGKVSERLPNIQVLLAGGYWDYQKDVEDEIARRGLRENVRIIGHLENTETLLNALDIGVLCSESEGFSNTILEYMAHGKPVIATRVGGNVEAVVEGEAGYLIALNDYAGLAKRIIELAQNPVRRVEMGFRGRQHVENKYSWDNAIGKWDVLFNNLISKKQLF